MDTPRLSSPQDRRAAPGYRIPLALLVAIACVVVASLATGDVAGTEVAPLDAAIASEGRGALPHGADDAHVPAQEHVALANPGLSLNGVAELVRYDDPNSADRRQIDSDIYPLLSGQSGYSWPLGSGEGGTDSGVGLLALPSLVKSIDSTAAATRIGITNLVAKPGFTDYVIVIYDQNGIIDFVCEKLNEEQTEYIDTRTWGYINPGFKGSAIASAVFWEHDVYEDTGVFVRNLFGLAGVVQELPQLLAPSRPSSIGSLLVPMYPQTGAPLSAHMYGHPIVCGGGLDPRFPTRVPTPGPSSTFMPTPTATPTPSVAPLYAGTSPHVMLPVLADLGPMRKCPSEIVVQNVGHVESKVALVTWGEPGPCGRPGEGPLKVECSGIIRPGTSWAFTEPQLPAGAKSAALFSFNMRLLDEVLPELGINIDDPIADYFCEVLMFGLPGDASRYREFAEAYTAGWPWLDIPMQEAWGAPMVAQLRRSCDSGSGSDFSRAAEYTGASGPALGYADSDPSVYDYALPLFTPGEDESSTFVYVQNASDKCVTAELWVEKRDACDRASRCAVAEIAPGESAMFDGRTCSAESAQSATVKSNGPVSVVVDIATSSVFASYMAPATEIRTLIGEPLLGESAPVAYAPLVYKNYEGWTTILHLQNTGSEASLLKATFLHRRGDVVSVRQFGPLCPGARLAIDLETVGGIPYWWVGNVRVESPPAADGPVATPWTPEPTSTAPGTPFPTITPGTGLPTVTPFPSSTPHGRHSVYLPLALTDDK